MPIPTLYYIYKRRGIDTAHIGLKFIGKLIGRNWQKAFNSTLVGNRTVLRSNPGLVCANKGESYERGISDSPKANAEKTP